ncbi:ABC transporter ATP-binding protein [Haploplasma axanthum]|uniref:ABC-type multidrug/protein/lipid transport system ATPase component n=1 Tax=Haploplasma axanthum TaxID=29552 RepID=A0A449BF26_HAPAX|nr:ABC transporter ATP-binding protein [Haploplasma axanthum]VEU81028.1 ABC-type multidrug/protein/lipid transport system ATPase component [Haploplasma axanthum]
MFSKHFRKYILKYGIFFLFGIAVLILIDYIQLDVPKILGQIIDLLNPNITQMSQNDMKIQLNSYIKEVIIVVLIVAFGRFLWRLCLFVTARKVEFELRNTMFSHATKLSQEFYSHEKVGGMMTYFINDLAAVRMALGPGIMMFVDSLFLGGFAIFRMFRLNSQLTYLVLVPIILMLVSMILINKSMRRQFLIRQEKFHDLSDFTQENFSGISVIKAYVREIHELNTFDRRSEELYDMNLKFFKKSVWVQLITTLATNLVIILIIGYGSHLVLNNFILADGTYFTSGNLVTYLSYFSALSWPIMALARFLTVSSQAQASAKRINDFLDSPVTVYDSNVIEDIKELIPSIEAKNLSFSYPDDNITVLHNLNFTIKPGEMVGILGKTGSGKTTLVDLLLRVYNVNKDSLFIGEHDIMTLPIRLVREKVGYVPQDNFLFSDTITKNIGFAYDNLSDEEVIKAAKLSDIYDNVNEFKEGFNTILGERGVTVSGGQKQRISIARAIAKNPEILILDDSVSAVDTKTEETIIKNLHELRKGKTTIFIAHRVSTVKNMDKIIIIDQGKIVDIGSHKQLMKKSLFYQDIVERQTLEEMVEGGHIDE